MYATNAVRALGACGAVLVRGRHSLPWHEPCSGSAMALGREARRASSALVLASLAMPGAARAQTPDITPKKPDVLLLLDTSQGMEAALDGDVNFDCVVDSKKPRWTILAEVLTGTINSLTCSKNASFVAYDSNTCRPFLNPSHQTQSFLSSQPYGWPVHHGHHHHSHGYHDTLVFCDPPYNHCSHGSHQCNETAGEWDQNSDGLLDLYATSVRFGVASYDSLELLPSSHPGQPFNLVLGNASWGTPDQCQAATNGAMCDESGNQSKPQYSYWFDGAAAHWLNGGRAPYAALIGTYGAAAAPWGQDHIDVGIGNPSAYPFSGRLVGFGPQDWSIGDPNLNCISDDTCTGLHNQLVERTVIGLWSDLHGRSAPLGAMLRDTYDYFHNDNASQGVHVPHDDHLTLSAEPALYGPIGPKTDAYFTSAARCRQAKVVLVSTGDRIDDIDDVPSRWAGQLLTDESVETLVVGVGTDTATWDPTGGGVTTVSDCATLTSADLAPAHLCERDATGKLWKYADTAPYNATAGVTPQAIRACCNLLEVAVDGSATGRPPRMPKTQLQLKQALDAAFQVAASGSISRTTPVFAPVTPAFAANAPAGAGAALWEVRSSMELGGSPYRGHLERLRRTCGPGGTPMVAPLAATSGDSLEQDLDVQPSVFPRKFFTVVPNDKAELRGSIRPRNGGATNADDQLFSGGQEGDFVRFGNSSSAFANVDVPVDVTQIAAEITGLSVAPTAADVLALTGADLPSCATAVGAGSLPQCADTVLQWFGGAADPDGAGTVAPSRAAGSPQCTAPPCSSLGGIHHTTPVVVPPPLPGAASDQNYGRVRSSAAQSFAQRFSGRPTMLYAQSIDGMLHGFVLGKNEFGTGGPFDVSVPSGGSLENNELWSFIPPAVLPAVWPSFNANARLLDGKLAWADVVYTRPLGAGAATTTDWDYATVIVGASGVSQAGGFYYALDVTNPLEPKFLWQLKASGTGFGGLPSDALFGDFVPGAAVGHIRFKDTLGNESILAVALLPGGTPSAVAPGATTGRLSSPTFPSHVPRGTIRDWGAAVPSRSLTVVELKTGRILARFAPSVADFPRKAGLPADFTQTNLPAPLRILGARAPFDSPISGVPTLYPTGGDTVADRAYVGDADGTLWRLDFSRSDPAQWRAEIAFDGFNATTLSEAWVLAGPGAGSQLGASPPSGGALAGQPILEAPTLSLAASGGLVISFATGDQDGFTTLTPGAVNTLVSYEESAGAGPGHHPRMSANTGVELAWNDGGRVTGPVNVFDGQIYFNYFVPAAPTTCALGSGGVCGVDAREKQASQAPIAQADLTGDGVPDSCVAFSHGEVAFGASVVLSPSCAGTLDPWDDPWLSGKYSSPTSSRTGTYQLLFHTGQGGSVRDGALTHSDAIDLPAPRNLTRTRSWVALIE